MSDDKPGKAGDSRASKIWITALFAILFVAAAVLYTRERGRSSALADDLEQAIAQRDACMSQLQNAKPDATDPAIADLRRQLQEQAQRAEAEAARAREHSATAMQANEQALADRQACQAELAACRANKSCPPVTAPISKPCPQPASLTAATDAACQAQLAQEKKRRLACEAELESGIRSTLP